MTRNAVVGDSMANGLGQALVDWAKNRTDVVVYNLSINGCPLTRGGTRKFPDGYMWTIDPECGWWSDPGSSRWQYATQFAPNVLFVQDGLNEVADRKLPSWPTYRHPGDPLFDTWALSEYRAMINALNGSGSMTTVIGNAVCGDWANLPHWQSMSDVPQRIQALNTLYQTLTADGDTVADLSGQLCPGGKYTTTVDGVSDARPDGYHLSEEAANVVVSRWLGPLLLSARANSPT